jgi:hypothetical protein
VAECIVLFRFKASRRVVAMFNIETEQPYVYLDRQTAEHAASSRAIVLSGQADYQVVELEI